MVADDATPGVHDSAKIGVGGARMAQSSAVHPTPRTCRSLIGVLLLALVLLLGAVSSAAAVPPPDSSSHGPLAGKVVAIDPGHQLGNARHSSQINRPVWVGIWKPCNTTGTATN